MPKMLLTDLSVRALKGSGKNEKFFDTKTPGFGIRAGVKAKTWIVMRGRNRELVTIGKYPDLSLADARIEAKKLLSTAPEPRAVSKTWAAARDEFLTENYKDSTSRWPHLVTLMLKKHFKGFDHRQLGTIEDSDINAVLGTLKKTPSTQLHGCSSLSPCLNHTAFGRRGGRQSGPAGSPIEAGRTRRAVTQ